MKDFDGRVFALLEDTMHVFQTFTYMRAVKASLLEATTPVFKLSHPCVP